MADQNLTLGVIFTGRIDDKLKQAINELKEFGRMKGFPAATEAAKDLKRTTKGVKDDTRVIGKQIGSVASGFERLTAAFRVVIAYGIAGTAIYRVVEALKAGTKAVIDYSQSLKNLQAIIGATDAEVEVMGAEMLNVAANTRYSAEEVSQAMILLGQSGLEAAQVLDTIGAVADLATGTLSDMATTSDLVTTALRAFGIDASMSGKVADIFASAVNKSKLTIDKLRVAFNYVAPVAAKAGVKLEDVTAAMMVLANAGVRASTIGTGLRQVFARLVAPTSKLREQYIAMGIDIDKLNPATNNFADIIERLTLIVPNAQRAFQLFGLRGAPAVAALTKAGVEGFREMRHHVLRVGVASEMARIQMEGLGVQIKQLGDKLGVLAIKMGEAGFAGTLDIIVRTLRFFTDAMIKAADSGIGRWLIGVIELTAAVATLRLTFRYLRNVVFQLALGLRAVQVRDMINMFGAFRVAMVALSGEIVLATANLTGLARAEIAVRIALMKLRAVILAHPFFMWLTLTTGVVLAFWQMVKRSAELTKELQKQWIEWDKGARKLEGYRKELEKNQNNLEDYRSTLERIRQEFKELGPQLDEAAGDLKKINDVMLKAIEIKELQKAKTAISEIDIELKKAGRGLEAVELVWEDWLVPDNVSENWDNIENAVRRIAINFKKWGWTTKTTVDEIIAKYRELGLSSENITTVVTLTQKVIHEYETLEKKMLALRKEAKIMPDFFLKLQSTLNDFEFGEFLLAYDQMTKDVERVNDNFEKIISDLSETGAKEFEDSMRRMSAAAGIEGATMAKHVAKLAEVMNKGLKTDKEIYDAKIELLKIFRRSMNDTLQQQIADVHKNFDELRKRVQEQAEPVEALAFEGVDMSYIDDQLKELSEKEKKAIADLARLMQARLMGLQDVVNNIIKTGQIAVIKATTDYEITLDALYTKYATTRLDKLDAWYKQEVDKANKAKNKQLEVSGVGKKEMEEIERKHLAVMGALNAKYKSERLAILTDMWKDESELQEKEGEIAALSQAIADKKTLDDVSDMRRKALQERIKILEEHAKEAEKAWLAIKDVEGAGEEEVYKVHMYFTDLTLELMKLRYRLMVENQKKMLKGLEEYSKKWYENEVKKLEAAGASWRELLRLEAEYLERGSELGEIKVGGLEDWESSFRGLSAGFKRVMADMRTNAQIASDALLDIFSQMQSSVSDILYDGFKTGFDNIRDLWQNLADAMLRIFTDLLAQMLVKWLVMGFAKMFGFGLGGGGGWNVATSGPGAAWTGPVGHEGGVVPYELTPKTFTAGLAQDEIVAVLKKNEVIFTPEQMKALGKLIAAPRVKKEFAKPVASARLFSPKQTQLLTQVLKSSTQTLATDTYTDHSRIVDRLESGFKSAIFTSSQLQILSNVIRESYKDHEFTSSSDQLKVFRSLVKDRDTRVLSEKEKELVEKAMRSDRELVVMKRDHAQLLKSIEKSVRRDSTLVVNESQLEFLREFVSKEKIDKAVSKDTMDRMIRIRDQERRISESDIQVIKESLGKEVFQKILSKDHYQSLTDMVRTSETNKYLTSDNLQLIRDTIEQKEIKKKITKDHLDRLKEIVSVRDTDSRFDAREIDVLREMLDSKEIERTLSDREIQTLSDTVKQYDTNKILSTKQVNLLKETVERNDIQRALDQRQLEILREVSHAHLEREHDVRTDQIAVLKEFFASKESREVISGQERNYLSKIIRDSSVLKVQTPKETSIIQEILESKHSESILGKDKLEVLRDIMDRREVSTDKHLDTLREIVDSREIADRIIDSTKVERVKELIERVQAFQPIAKYPEIESLRQIVESPTSEKILSSEKLSILRDFIQREDSQRVLEERHVSLLRELMDSKDVSKSFTKDHQSLLRDIVDRKYLVSEKQREEIREVADHLVRETQVFNQIFDRRRDQIEKAFEGKDVSVLEKLVEVKGGTVESILERSVPSPSFKERIVSKTKQIAEKVTDTIQPMPSPVAAVVGAGAGLEPAPAPGGVVAHGGGVVGRDIMRQFEMSSVIDRGMKADEVLAILKKNETVFTPNQMKKLGEMMGRAGVGDTTSINVPVSVGAGGRGRRLANELRYEIEDVVKRTLKRQLM